MQGLPAGFLLAHRFAIESRLGEGGMAVVYRGRDLTTGGAIAIKLLHPDTTSPYILDHFLYEAEILASLRHPRIVAYVAHGRADSGEAFLVMEWLDGEDLSHRLQRGPLTLPDSLRLVARVADALAAVHARGIVHRDIKPQNLFLQKRQIDQVTLLDFGVAHRAASEARARTQTGAVIGTPEYMAPEQVRGTRTLGPAADVFSLGCVLYECLAGRPPFAAGQVVSVLAKILFEEAPDIRLLRPGVPSEVAELLARMLAKDEGQRIADGATLESALRALPEFTADEQPVPTPPGSLRPTRLRGELQELLSVILASAAGAIGPAGETVQVASQELLVAPQRDLLAELRQLGAHAEFLLDGSLVAVLRQWSSAADQAAQAAQAALLIQKRWPQAQIAVTTGRGLRPDEMPMGEVLDRAARLLVADTMAGAGVEDPVGDVVLDEVTAELVEQRFSIERRGARLILRGARGELDASRPLLGKATPCVGRERELAQLDAVLAATIEEPMAQAVLVVGPPGSGKSRLRHEFLRRLGARHGDVAVLIGRGAPLSMGAAFGILGQLLRGLCGVSDIAEPAERWRRLRERIALHLPPERGAQVAALLGLISQVEPPAAAPAPAALRDPNLLHEQIVGAFVEFLQAECGAGPVLLILEDLHWGDLPTMRLLDAALRELRGQPLLVMALARPEIETLFPKLWHQRSLHHVPLWGLSKRACEQLIRQVLGPGVSPEVTGRIVAQAAGNALFLEELIRGVAEGKSEAAPDTVLAMLQARLGRLEARSRTALCAASVFGSVLWRGGVTALLPAELRGDEEALLGRLVEQEILVRHAATRLPGEVEYGFRHDLLRDAAYALLTAEDRQLGHYLAASYLESAGEREAAILAQHYRLGGAPAEAAKWYRRSAEQALDANELGTAQQRAQSAIDAGAKGEALGQLYGLQATAAYWLRNDAETRRCAEQALSFLTPGSADFYQCAAHVLVSCGRLKDWDAVTRWLDGVLAAPVESGALAARALCFSRTGYMFMLQGRPAQMKQMAELLAGLAPELPASEPLAIAQVSHFRSGCAMLQGDLVAGIRYMEETIDAFAQANDQRNALHERNTLACNYVEIGQHEEGERLARVNLRECERLKLAPPRSLARVILGYALTFFPDRAAEAEATLGDALTHSQATGNVIHQGWAQSALARLHCIHGRLAQSEEHARLAVALTAKDSPTFQAWPLGWLARALVRQGRATEGLACAEQAVTNMKTLGGFTMAPMVPPLARAEALLALGQTEAAAQAVASAKRRILRVAERLQDATWRQHFLHHPENRATLELP